ncbi:MAG: hypothetical protein J6V09_00250 [Clostridia bacterium]|nr:hypothetical protein [Clostridia bacterium]
MRRIISFILCAVMLVSALAIVGCGETKALKFGAGSYTTVSATSATPENEETGAAAKNGQGEAVVTAAAVLVDANGKIVKCVIDSMQNKVSYNLMGEAIANTEFKTKKEQGDTYNMVGWGGAAKEWYEQVAAFEALVIGKTIDEVKALVVNGDKGTEEVINAGCTITIVEFVHAIEKAVASAKTTNATDVKLGMSTSQTVTNATPENEETGAAAKDGTNQVETTIFAAAVDSSGKIVDCAIDCAQVKFTFDLTGQSTFDATKEIKTKREQGDAYNMVGWGGAVAEWYTQADTFAAKCVGKTGAQVASLMETEGANAGKGTSDIISAGCTIYVNGFVAAAVKIG